MQININGSCYSHYRLGKMLETIDNAVKLRGLDRCLEVISCGSLQRVRNKKDRLKTLFERLHSNIDSSSCEKIIVFNRIHNLVRTPGHGIIDFKIELEDNCIVFKIGNKNILSINKIYRTTKFIENIKTNRGIVNNILVELEDENILNTPIFNRSATRRS